MPPNLDLEVVGDSNNPLESTDNYFIRRLELAS